MTLPFSLKPLHLALMLAALGVAGPVSAQTSCTIEGKINFAGEQPAGELFRIAGDDFCERAAESDPPRPQDVVVNENRTLKNVLVYISKGWADGHKPMAKDTGAVHLTAKGCMFRPHLVVMQTTQKLMVSNADDTLHNVNVLPANNLPMNKVLMPGDADPLELSFTKPEIGMKLRDAIHPWMSATIAVLDHTDYAVSGDDGHFRITGVAQGEYTLTAWHETFGAVSTDILVRPDVPTEVVFNFTATGTKAGNQTDAKEVQTTAPIAE